MCEWTQILHFHTVVHAEKRHLSHFPCFSKYSATEKIVLKSFSKISLVTVFSSSFRHRSPMHTYFRSAAVPFAFGNKCSMLSICNMKVFISFIKVKMHYANNVLEIRRFTEHLNYARLLPVINFFFILLYLSYFQHSSYIWMRDTLVKEIGSFIRCRSRLSFKKKTQLYSHLFGFGLLHIYLKHLCAILFFIFSFSLSSYAFKWCMLKENKIIYIVGGCFMFCTNSTEIHNFHEFHLRTVDYANQKNVKKFTEEFWTE